MGKRSNFQRRKNDAYDTPYEAVLPLIPHLERGCTYYEPCYGHGCLAAAINEASENTIKCIGYSDILGPLGSVDACTTDYTDKKFDYFITNPPWSRDLLHPIIQNLRRQKPTWLLFDADWMHTKQSAELIKYCRSIVSVGRVKWIPNSPFVGKDNACWYCFDDANPFASHPKFYGRQSDVEAYRPRNTNTSLHTNSASVSMRNGNQSATLRTRPIGDNSLPREATSTRS